MKQAFVSHASEDYVVAKAICRMLEERGISCWIAPDDLVAGRSYGKEIIKGIEEASVTLLLLSRHSNVSQFVCREIERAVSKHKPVLPVRLEDVQPSDDLELFVAANQWIDVWPSPRAETLDRLADAIRQSRAASMAVPVAAKPEIRSEGTGGEQPPPRPVLARKLVLAGCAGIAVIAGAAAWQMAGRSATPAAPAVVVPATQAQRPAQAEPMPASQDRRPAQTATVESGPSPAAVAQDSVAPVPVTAPASIPRAEQAQSKPAAAAPAAKQAAASHTPSNAEAPKPPKKSGGVKVASAAHAEAPAATHHAASTRSASCVQILERASLGEPLSKEDNATLRTQC